MSEMRQTLGDMLGRVMTEGMALKNQRREARAEVAKLKTLLAQAEARLSVLDGECSDSSTLAHDIWEQLKADILADTADSEAER